MSHDCVDLYNDKALRSTQGAVFHLDIVRDELSHVIPELQKLGVRVIATSLHNASSIDDIKSTDKMAFIMKQLRCLMPLFIFLLIQWNHLMLV